MIGDALSRAIAGISMNVNPYRPPADFTEPVESPADVSTMRWLVVMFLFMITPGIVLLVASLL